MTPKIQSMTGYGSSELISDNISLEIEIKTVNHRYLDIQFKMPRALQIIEPKLKLILESKITRGTVYCSLQYESKKTDSSALKLNEGLLSQYLGILETIKQKTGEEARVDLLGLLKIPDLVTADNNKLTPEILEAEILPVFSEACDALVQSRQAEGNKLYNNIIEKVSGFTHVIEAIKGLLPDRQKEVREKYQKKINSLIEGESSLSAERVMTEIGMLSERLDVDEELVRFNSHLTLFKETLNSHVPGKKLGFVLQEMLREINTMSSKCQYAPIQHHCVALKEDIEKIREQGMNLE